jgi:hypothetical protein
MVYLSGLVVVLIALTIAGLYAAPGREEDKNEYWGNGK